MLITYKDVYNIISEKQYSTEYVLHSGLKAPLLIYWKSTWQVILSIEHDVAGSKILRVTTRSIMNGMMYAENADQFESYRNKLKTFYLGRPRNQRIDRLVYMLTDQLVLDYRRNHLQTSLGIRPAKLSMFEKKTKDITDSIYKQVAIYMIRKINEQISLKVIPVEVTEVVFTKSSIIIRPVEVENKQENGPQVSVVLAEQPDIVEYLKEKTLKQKKIIMNLIERKASEISYDNLAEMEDFHVYLAGITSVVEKTLFP
ncbi:hypothetical protein INT48_001309, partial [Thamnidium elegans]